MSANSTQCGALESASTYVNKGGKTVRKNKRWLFKKPPPNLRDFIDYPDDVLSSMSESDLDYLSDFLDAYYTGKKNDLSSEWTTEELRKSYQRNNNRVRDFYNHNRKNYPKKASLGEGVHMVTPIDHMIKDEEEAND